MTNSQAWQAPGIAMKWWSELTSSQSQRGHRRASIARLRRARNSLEAIYEQETLRLIRQLPNENPDRVAVLAGILAFVTESDARKVARAIGRSSIDDAESAQMSEARFRRLLLSRGDELLDTMRRVVRLTKGRANVYDLSHSILRWGDRVKKQWIFDYYNVFDETSSKQDAQTIPSRPTEPNT